MDQPESIRGSQMKKISIATFKCNQLNGHIGPKVFKALKLKANSLCCH